MAGTRLPGNLTEGQVWRLIVRTVLLIIAIGALAWFAWTVRGVLVLVAFASVLAAGMAPIVDAIAGEAPRRRYLRLPRVVAVLSLYLLLGLGITAFLAGVVPPLVHQSEELVREAPTYLAQAQLVLTQYQQDYPFLEGLDARLLGQLEDSLGTISSSAGQIVELTIGVVGGLLDLVLLLVLVFYLSVDGDRIRGLFLKLVPAPERPRVAQIVDRMGVKVGGWLLGQFFLSLIIGVLTFVGLTVIGVPYAALLAVVAAIGEIIPMLGPVIAAIPAVIVAFFVSPLHGVLTVVLYVIVQQLENNLVVPQVMRRTVALPPVIVIVALLIGAEFMGIVGAILAVPVAAMIGVLVGEFVPSEESDETQPASESETTPVVVRSPDVGAG